MFTIERMVSGTVYVQRDKHNDSLWFALLCLYYHYRFCVITVISKHHRYSDNLMMNLFFKNIGQIARYPTMSNTTKHKSCARLLGSTITFAHMIIPLRYGCFYIQWIPLVINFALRTLSFPPRAMCVYFLILCFINNCVKLQQQNSNPILTCSFLSART